MIEDGITPALEAMKDVTHETAEELIYIVGERAKQLLEAAVPLVDTGNMQSSPFHSKVYNNLETKTQTMIIAFHKDQFGGDNGEGFYPSYIEHGTEDMDAEPFMRKVSTDVAREFRNELRHLFDISTRKVKHRQQRKIVFRPKKG